MTKNVEHPISKFFRERKEAYKRALDREFDVKFAYVNNKDVRNIQHNINYVVNQYYYIGNHHMSYRFLLYLVEKFPQYLDLAIYKDGEYIHPRDRDEIYFMSHDEFIDSVIEGEIIIECKNPREYRECLQHLIKH